MSIFGIPTRKDMQALRDEITALKADKNKYEPWQLATAEAEKWNIPDPSVYGNQADLYRQLSWVLQAVDITASASAVTKYSIARQIPDQEPEDIPAHPYEIKLQRPNPQDSRYEFIYGRVAMYKLTGNAYRWLNRTSQDMPPTEMWVIPSHMITPVPDGKMYLRGYLYQPGNGMEIFLEPWEIVHDRRFNPFSRFIGLSAVESIAMSARGLLGMQEWNTRLFKENNARLPGIITFEQMVEDGIWKKIKDDTREAARNRELMMLRGVGQGGINWMQNSVSQKEMEFLEGIKASGKQIMDTLAPGLYTWLSGESTYSNAGANRAAFNELTLYPMHVMMSEKDTNEILPAYGENLVGNFEDVRFADRQLELQERAADEKIMTLEELRREYKQLDPLGDERDKLLPAQITAQQPEPLAGQPEAEETPETIQEQEPAVGVEEPEAENNALKGELDKWRRKAVKKIGQAVPFESDVIPADVNTAILSALPACKSDTEVRGLFAKYKTVPAKSEVLELARAIDRAVSGMVA